MLLKMLLFSPNSIPSVPHLPKEEVPKDEYFIILDNMVVLKVIVHKATWPLSPVIHCLNISDKIIILKLLKSFF